MRSGRLSVADIQTQIKTQFENIAFESLEGYASLFISFSNALPDEFCSDAAESVFSEIYYLGKSDSCSVIQYGLLLRGCIHDSGTEATEAKFRRAVGASEHPVHWVLFGPKVGDPKFRTRLKRLGSWFGNGFLDVLVDELGGPIGMGRGQIVNWVKSSEEICKAMSDQFLALYILLCLVRRLRLHHTPGTSRRLSPTFTVDDARRLEEMIASIRIGSVDTSSAAGFAKRKRNQSPKSRSGGSPDVPDDGEGPAAVLNGFAEHRRRVIPQLPLDNDKLMESVEGDANAPPNAPPPGSSERNTSVRDSSEVSRTVPAPMDVAVTPTALSVDEAMFIEEFLGGEDEGHGGAGADPSTDARSPVSGGDSRLCSVEASNAYDDADSSPPPGTSLAGQQTLSDAATPSIDRISSPLRTVSSPRSGSSRVASLSEARGEPAVVETGDNDSGTPDEVSTATREGDRPVPVGSLLTPPDTAAARSGSAVAGTRIRRHSGFGDGGRSLSLDPLHRTPKSQSDARSLSAVRYSGSPSGGLSPSEAAAARGLLRSDRRVATLHANRRCSSADVAAVPPDQLSTAGSFTGLRTQSGYDETGDVAMTHGDSHSSWSMACDKFIRLLRSRPDPHEHWVSVDIGVVVATLVRDLPMGGESDFAHVTGSTRIRLMDSADFMGFCDGDSSSARDLSSLLCVALSRGSIGFRDCDITVDGVADEWRCRSESGHLPAHVTVAMAEEFGDSEMSQTEEAAFELWKNRSRGKHHVSFLGLDLGLYMGPSCLEKLVWIYRRAVGHVRATGLRGYIDDADVVDIRPRGYVGRWTSSKRQLWTYIRLHNSSAGNGLPACLVVVADSIDGPDQCTVDSIPDGAGVVCLRPKDSIVIPRGKRWFLVVMQDTLVASGNFWPLGDLPAAVDVWRRTVAAGGKDKDDTIVGRVMAEYLSSLPEAMVGAAREELRRLVMVLPRCSCAVGDEDQDDCYCACVLAGEKVCQRSCCIKSDGRYLVDEFVDEGDGDIEMGEAV